MVNLSKLRIIGEIVTNGVGTYIQHLVKVDWKNTSYQFFVSLDEIQNNSDLIIRSCHCVHQTICPKSLYFPPLPHLDLPIGILCFVS